MSLRFIDAETTGLHADAELLELAIVDADGVVLLDTLIRPEREQQWPDAEAVHGIAPAHVERAPTASELTDQVAAILRGADVVACNADFERAAAAGDADPQRSMRCAMTAFADEFGDWDEFRGERRFVSLDEAAANVLSPRRERHRALGDARSCRAVWLYLTDAAERLRVDAIWRAQRAHAEAQAHLRLEDDERSALQERERKMREHARVQPVG